MRTVFRIACSLLCLGLAACAEAAATAPTAVPTPLPTPATGATVTAVPLELLTLALPTSPPLPTPAITATLATTVAAQSLVEPGPYIVGVRSLVFSDDSRDGREIPVRLYYPAIWSGENAVPDYSHAPYPLILYSPSIQYSTSQTPGDDLAYLLPHLVSHGFSVAAIGFQAQLSFPELTTDGPLDALLALDQLARLAEGDLAGLINTEQVGVAGYEFGSYVALSLAGARQDPVFRADWCREPTHIYAGACLDGAELAQREAYHARFVTPPAAGELWPSWGDTRIQAALLLGGTVGPVFGQRGLAAVATPTLIMAGTADSNIPYRWAAAFVYENLGTDDRYLISIPRAANNFARPVDRRYSQVQTFATAFFGRFLQGREAYAPYLTEAYVNSVDDAFWGVYGAATPPPTPLPAVTAVPPVPPLLLPVTALAPITPDNLAQIEELSAMPRNAICTVAFSPDGQWLAASGDKVITLWNLADGQVAHTLANGCIWMLDVAFSADAARLAATSPENCEQAHVRVWDVAGGELLWQQLGDFEHGATGVAFSPDGSLVATGTGCVLGLKEAASVKVWDTASGTLLLDIPMPTYVSDVAFSPDGTMLAAASGEGIISVWDVATGASVSSLVGHMDYVSRVAFSPDGTRLISGGYDGVRLWDLANSAPLFLIEKPVAGVVDVAFMAGGQVARISGGNRIIFWDTTTGAALAEAQVGSDISSVAFSPDNTLLATCGHDQLLRLWGVPAAGP